VRCLLQMMDIEEQTTCAMQEINCLRDAIKSIRNTDEFARLLLISLAMGNYLNAKVSMGRLPKPKYGVQIDAVTKLFPTFKSKDGRRNLMDHLLGVFDKVHDMKSEGHEVDVMAPDFYEKLAGSLNQASALNPLQLEKDMVTLQEKLDIIRSYLVSVPVCRGGVQDNFHSVVNTFVNEIRVEETVSAFGRLNEEFGQVAEFLCFDPYVFSFDGTPLTELVKTVRGFFEGNGCYVEALERKKTHQRLEELKRRRAEQRKALEDSQHQRGIGRTKRRKALDAADKGFNRELRGGAVASKADFDSEFGAMLKNQKKKVQQEINHDEEQQK